MDTPTPKQFMKQRAKEIHKPVVRKFTRARVVIPAVMDTWSMDLVDMKDVLQYNSHRYMLNIVDGYSRYAWSVPLKTKTAREVWDAFEKCVTKAGGYPKKIWVDQGTEFYNALWTANLAKHNIVRYSTFGEHKSVLVERFNRTLKEEMWRRFSAAGERTWDKTHDALLKWYNTKIHSSLKDTPANVFESGERKEEKRKKKGRDR